MSPPGTTGTTARGAAAERVAGAWLRRRGLRRLDANFGVDYAGCYSYALCTEDQLTPAADSFEENLTGWTAGAGVEQRLGGSVGIRGELRYTRYGSAERVIPYDDLAIRVPLAVQADGVGAQLGLIWYF